MSSVTEGAGIAFVLSAPSGAGKTTLAAALLERLSGIERTVSCTTRGPRAGEADGRDYTFLTAQEFDQLESRGAFLECADVHGHRYGTPRQELERIARAGDDALLVIDVQGAAQVVQRLDRAVTIFVLPPSRQVLEERLNRRDGNKPRVDARIRRRLGVATEEIACFVRYDYVVINDDFEAAVRELECIVVAERCRQGRRSNVAQSILESFQ